tara:strand:+ start:17101 stop:18159 length:1059 start_codon:yes stop_codon:yes gene_type:complete
MVIVMYFGSITVTRADDRMVRQTLDLDEVLPKGATTIWTPGFQRCWDEVRGMFNLKKIDLVTPTSEVLDAFEWDANATIPIGTSISVVGGKGPEFARTANRIIDQAFGPGTPKLNPKDWNVPMAQGICCLTVMKQSVEFELPFREYAPGPAPFKFTDGREESVRYFGSYGSLKPQYAGAGWVLAYEPGELIAVRLRLKEADQSMFLVMDSRIDSIARAIDLVRKLGGNAKKPESRLDGDDTLLVPYLALANQANFLPLLNGGFRGPGDPYDHRFHAALQLVELELNESGAEMETRSFLVPPGFLGGPGKLGKGEPRKLVFDHPFFLLLWKKGGSHPYLATYVGGGGLVMKPN